MFFKSTGKVKFGKNFLKLYLSHMIVLIIPIVLIGIFSYQISFRAIEKETSQNNLKLMRLIHKSFTVMVEELEIKVLNLIHNESITNLVPGDRQASMFNIYKGTTALSQATHFDDLIRFVYVYDIRQGKVYSSDRGGPREAESVFDSGWIEQILSNQVFTGWMKESPGRQVFLGNSRELLYIQQIPWMGTKPLGMVIFIINEDVLWQNLNTQDQTELMQMFVLDGQGNPLTSFGMNKSFEWAQTENIAKMALSRGQSGNFFDNNKEYLISYMISENNNWIYLILADWKKATGFLDYIKSITLLLVFVVSVAGIFLCYFLSRGIYNPISKMMQKILETNKRYDEGPGKKIVFVDEFKYMSGVINDITTDNQDLRNFFVENRVLLRDKLVTDLLNGRPVEEKKTLEKLNQLDVSFTEGFYFVYVIELENVNEIESLSDPTEKAMLIYTIKKMVSVIVNALFRCVVVETESENIAILCNTDSPYMDKEIRNVAEKIKGEAKSRMNIQISIGIGKTYQSIAESSKSFQDAVRALKYRLFTGKNSVIHINDISKVAGEILYYFPSNKETVLSNLVRSGDYTGIVGVIDEIIDELKANQNLSIECIHQIFVRFAGSAINIVLEMGGSIKEIFGEDFNAYAELAKKETFEDIRDLILYIYEKITAFVESLKSCQENRYIKLTKEYIEKNYRRDITLDSIAEEVNLNPAYLSSLFKEITGCNIVKYINQLRIEESKRLLLQTELTIQDISRHVGYNNQQSFIRFFKMFEGTTPGKFREIRIQ